MAKKPMGEKKKANRKVKRQVRRTSAIVLLITAIIVAAIPVPENAAAPGAGGGSGTARDSSVYEYTNHTNAVGGMTEGEYDSEGKKLNTANDYIPNSVMFGGYDLAKNIADPYKAYTIQKVDEQWVYQWQFEYYYVNGKTVISK
ncbi:MAG: hypothetical protein MSH20_02040, partial [Lachnospiraceae bacterium]|nr:hypothetical protein [Lachnospiraceae bacterium]